MAHFKLGNVVVTPQAAKKMKEFALSTEYVLKKHQLQNFEPMPEYALLQEDQMYLADMEKNTQIIAKQHGRVFSYFRHGETMFYIFTSLRLGRAESTLLCLAEE